MDTVKKDLVHISGADLSKLLIATCRYGYTRNNHLMPSSAYLDVKRFIPQLYEVEKEQALNTLQQICEESISDELLSHFPDGEDDEHNNRLETIKFINWCIATIQKDRENWIPYNYSSYLDNLNKDSEPRYYVYQLISTARLRITEHPVSQEDYMKVISDAVTKSDASDNFMSYKCSSSPAFPEILGDRRKNHLIEILSPKTISFYVEHI